MIYHYIMIYLDDHHFPVELALWMYLDAPLSDESWVVPMNRARNIRRRIELEMSDGCVVLHSAVVTLDPPRGSFWRVFFDAGHLAKKKLMLVKQ